MGIVFLCQHGLYCQQLVTEVFSIFRSKVANETAFDQWVDSAKGAALPWSLWLYRKLLGMGFQLILLTGRKETHRNSTEQNLVSAGYHSWHKLILK